jgi:uncharacterized protein YndB with AHSA1/START domain
MIGLSVQVLIDVPPAQVWAVLADYTRDVEWRAGVKQMTPDPRGTIRAGTLTHERIRVAGRTYRNDGEVVRVAAGRRFEWRTTSGALAWGAREVRGHGAGSVAQLELKVRPRGLESAFAPLLRVLLARTLRGDAGRLRALVLQQAAVSAADSRAAASRAG